MLREPEMFECLGLQTSLRAYMGLRLEWFAGAEEFLMNRFKQSGWF